MLRRAPRDRDVRAWADDRRIRGALDGRARSGDDRRRRHLLVEAAEAHEPLVACEPQTAGRSPRRARSRSCPPGARRRPTPARPRSEPRRRGSARAPRPTSPHAGRAGARSNRRARSLPAALRSPRYCAAGSTSSSRPRRPPSRPDRGERPGKIAERAERLDPLERRLGTGPLEASPDKERRLTVGRHDEVRALRRAGEVVEVCLLDDERGLEPGFPQATLERAGPAFDLWAGNHGP